MQKGPGGTCVSPGFSFEIRVMIELIVKLRYRDIYNFLIYKIAFMCMLALFLEGTADTSYLSGKGMGYFMLLAMALRGSYITKSKNNRFLKPNVIKDSENSDINNVSDGNDVNT